MLFRQKCGNRFCYFESYYHPFLCDSRLLHPLMFVAYHVLPGPMLQHECPRCVILFLNPSTLLVAPIFLSTTLFAPDNTLGCVVHICFDTVLQQSSRGISSSSATLPRDSVRMLRRYLVVCVSYRGSSWHYTLLIAESLERSLTITKLWY